MILVQRGRGGWVTSAGARGAMMLALGALGVVLGCSAHFTLPPPLGILPAFAGWGIVRAIRIAWKASNRPDSAGSVYID